MTTADYQRFLGEIRARVLGWRASRFEPDELAQEALLRAHASGALDTERLEQPEAWGYLHRAARTTMIDLLRWRGRAKRAAVREEAGFGAAETSPRMESALVADHTSPSERASKNEQLRRLERAMELLPGRQRRAVELHHLRGLSLRETAGEMQVSVPAAAGYLRRALQAMRDELGAAPGI